MARKRGIDAMHEELSEAQAGEGWHPAGSRRVAEAAPSVEAAGELEPEGAVAEESRVLDEVGMAGWQPGTVMEPTRAVFTQLGRPDGQGRMVNIRSQRTVLGVRGEGGRVQEVDVPGIVTYTADEMQMGIPVRYLVREEATGRITAFHEVFIPPRRLEYLRYESRLIEPIDVLQPSPEEVSRATPPAGTPVGPSDGGAPGGPGPDLRTLTAAFASGAMGR